MPLQSSSASSHGTMAFRFDKPLGWVFKGRQFLDMTLLNPAETNAEGNTHSLSIASGPDEDTLMVATGIRDRAFKGVTLLHNGWSVQLREASINRPRVTVLTTVAWPLAECRPTEASCIHGHC
jgi:hypothetical protein